MVGGIVPATTEDLEGIGRGIRGLPGNGARQKGLMPLSPPPRTQGRLCTQRGPYHLKPLFCHATYAALSPSTVRCNILSVELEEKAELA